MAAAAQSCLGQSALDKSSVYSWLQIYGELVRWACSMILHNRGTVKPRDSACSMTMHSMPAAGASGSTASKQADSSHLRPSLHLALSPELKWDHALLKPGVGKNPALHTDLPRMYACSRHALAWPQCSSLSVLSWRDGWQACSMRLQILGATGYRHSTCRATPPTPSLAWPLPRTTHPPSIPHKGPPATHR